MFLMQSAADHEEQVCQQALPLIFERVENMGNVIFEDSRHKVPKIEFSLVGYHLKRFGQIQGVSMSMRP